MTKFKAVLFDLDGTLRDTRDAIYDAYQKTIEHHAGQQVEREAIKPHVHHHSVVHKAFADHVTEDEFRQTYSDHADQSILDSPLYDGAEAVLSALKQAGYKLALVTTATQGNVEKYLDTTHHTATFDAIAGMIPGRHHKPAPDVVEAAIGELGCSLQDVIMVGDMTVDIEAAHAAGVKCIGITHGFASKAELEAAGADYIVDSLVEIPSLIEKIETA